MLWSNLLILCFFSFSDAKRRVLYCGANPKYKNQYVLVIDMTASSEFSPFDEEKTYYYIGKLHVRDPNIFLEKYTLRNMNISEKKKTGKTSVMGHVLLNI